MSDLSKQAQTAFALRMDLWNELRVKGGEWLGACREWLKSNVHKGDILKWDSGEPVSVPFYRFEELAHRVAVAAVMEDRQKNRQYMVWNKNAKLIPEDTPVLVRFKGDDHPVMCIFREELSIMLDQDYYGMLRDLDDVEGWLDPSRIKMEEQAS